MRLVAPLLFAVYALLQAGCRDASASASSGATTSAPPPIASATAAPLAPSSSPPPVASAAPPASAPAQVERVAVPTDSPAFFVRGASSLDASADASRTRVVFLPGRCSNAYAYLLGFPEAARAHGGIVAIDGNEPCGAASSGFHSFTWDRDLQLRRIDKALAAVGAPDPPDGFTLVGYSAGASIAEMIHERWPQRFPRVVIIAPPVDPVTKRYKSARGVVTMSCALDVPWRMKDATKRLEAASVPSVYLEMPGCMHGNIADGERIFDEAFTFLDTQRE